ncbi:4-hydroxy-3-methylbut-2-enyl diphosphate reductase [Pectinatus sottacetonis]|uniref:4-hydroxy-3-methylbut-2-enyl diphosphate reductase n=1 Tax=Pectinatus sottacetonis TaxID=1002795 RepID=UPI0018C6F600|nr:4-hydroxy-3-methylbut-2-enyl diphosphate reductase [Pectinatus sottacetonis]
MDIILADYLGFCYGVKRAIKLAREQAGKDKQVVTLGPIIHNPQMVKQLADEGIGLVNSLDEIDKGTVIIRSHGVGPSVYKRASEKGLRIIDATCPHVKKAQMSAKTLAEEGYFVVIIGEKAHPEVKSIVEWSGRSAVVIEDVHEAEKLHFVRKLGIVAQTTFSRGKFKQLVDILIDKSNDIKVLRTICTATEQRQAAAEELAMKVDMMLVIGGKNSANTTRLASLCAKKCPTYHIETADELKDNWFHHIEKIGVTAGASTPDWLIREVYRKCKNKNKTCKVY